VRDSDCILHYNMCSVVFFAQIIDDTDVNWFKAEYNGKFGYIPANYVQYVRPP